VNLIDEQDAPYFRYRFGADVGKETLAPGDVVEIGRAGLDPALVQVDGVVDLPEANALFQKVGVPPGAQPQAPPDNVVLLPEAQWHQIFDPLVAIPYGCVFDDGVVKSVNVCATGSNRPIFDT